MYDSLEAEMSDMCYLSEHLCFDDVAVWIKSTFPIKPLQNIEILGIEETPDINCFYERLRYLSGFSSRLDMRWAEAYLIRQVRLEDLLLPE